MPTDMNWREIIKRYLDACREDQQVGARAETHAHLMLMSCSSSSLLHNVTDFRAVRVKLSETPLGLVEDYKPIEESHDRVVAEVDRCKDGQPPVRSRFRLVRHDGAWFLDDVYWACHCEDAKCFSCDDGRCKLCSEGKCSHCDGLGSCRCWIFFTRCCMLCEGSGACLLCHGKVTCDFCEGLGRCRSCADSDMPGWISIYRKFSVESEEDAQL